MRIAECRKRGTLEERRRPGRTPHREKSGEKSEERRAEKKSGEKSEKSQRVSETQRIMYSGLRVLG